MAKKLSEVWPQIVLGILGSLIIALLTLIFNRLGQQEERLSKIAERTAATETLVNTMSKQLDALQPRRFEDAVKSLELAAGDVRKASIMASDAAKALEDARKGITPQPPRR